MHYLRINEPITKSLSNEATLDLNPTGIILANAGGCSFQLKLRYRLK